MDDEQDSLFSLAEEIKKEELANEISSSNYKTQTNIVDENRNLTSLKEAAANFSNAVVKRKLSDTAYVDRVQIGGRWTPAFPAASKEKEEAYIQKMLDLDKKQGK